jgi:nucleoside-diphosphate kinase
MQKTYVMIKPHFANYKIVVDEIKKRLLNLGVKITTEGFIKYDKNSAEQHYAEHVGKPFYPELERYITSDKAYGMIIEGENAISQVRSIAGATIKKDKETGELRLPDEGTIRRDIPKLIGEECRQTENVLHSSDSEESARREIEIFKKLLKKTNQKSL